MRLAFHATSTSAHVEGEVADCSFTSATTELGLMSEDGRLCRVAWSAPGHAGEDEGVIGLAQVELWPGRLAIDFEAGPHSAMPFDGVDITYEDLDDRSLDLVEVFRELLCQAPDRLRIHD
jgi:hypothetical protein